MRTESDSFVRPSGGHRRSTRGNIWGLSGKNHLDLSFLFSLNSWMLWSPVWLPMIFVITPPLSEVCNFRTGVFVFLLFFVRWNQRYLGQWSHLLKNASLSSLLYAILVPRLWPTRIEIHCENCEKALAQQVKCQEVGWKLRCWRRFPWRIFSRHFGALLHTQFRPHFINTLLIYFYIWLFDCNLEEANCDNVSKYRSLGDFFTRNLKPGVRPICPKKALVSPADGHVTFQGCFEGGFVEQVKGVHYSLPYFLGLSAPKNQPLHGAVLDTSLILHQHESNVLYQAVIYLSPGDYHRFHSTVSWKIHTRRHFPGELLSVKPSVVNSCPGLFHLNERVAWLGEWEHGFFSMTAIGATNVGSIHLDNGNILDPELKTNRPYGRRSRCDMAKPCSTRNFYYTEKTFAELSYRKGQAFGHFSFGSTIVLIFEAPKNFQFEDNARVLVGQSL